MDYPVLIAELTNDPLGRGYAGMSDKEVAVDLLAEYRSRVRASMSGDDIFAAMDATNFAGLTDHKRELWLALCGRDSVNPSGAANVGLVTWLFGGASTTLANLVAARQEPISRATELGLGRVREGDVQRARS